MLPQFFLEGFSRFSPKEKRFSLGKSPDPHERGFKGVLKNFPQNLKTLYPGVKGGVYFGVPRAPGELGPKLGV